MPALSIHRYPTTSLAMDGLRATFGLAVSFGPLMFFDVAWPLAIVLAGMGSIFLIFALRLIDQYWSSIELTGDGICLRGAKNRELRWLDLTSLKLAHYGPVRRSSQGWYQLSLHGEGGRLRVDSTIDRFGEIVTMAKKAARERAIDLDPSTLDNLKALQCETSNGQN